MVIYRLSFRNTVGFHHLFAVDEIKEEGLNILSETGLPSTNLLIIVTYATSTISVLFGVMKFLCFSPQKMIILKGFWEYFSTLVMCFITPFVRKCFYGLCTYHLIVNIYSNIHHGGTDNVIDAKSTSNISSYANNAELPRSLIKAPHKNCTEIVPEADYLKAMNDHTWFYLYILLSSVVPTVLLTFVTLFATTEFRCALKAIFKFPIMLFEPLVMPFVFQGVEDFSGMIKAQSSDVLEWKSGKSITVSLWATDINFLNIILDGVFGCMFAALSTELEQLCVSDMLEKNTYFNILMWAGLGLKLLLHLLVLLIKFGCPETILCPSYQKLGALDLDEGSTLDTMSTNSSDDIEFERGPGICRQYFGRFVAVIAILLGVCGTLAISVAFFVFVYGGFGIQGVNKVELSDLEKMAEDYGLLLSIPTLALFIPVSLVLWSCLRAHSKSYNSEFNTNTIPRGCYSCCLQQSTAAFFLFIVAFSMILLPAGLVFAVVIGAQKEITFRNDIKVPGYLMGAAMAASIMLLIFICSIPSCFYFLWYRGFRQGFTKSKESWFDDNDQRRFNDQVNDVKKTQPKANPYVTVVPVEGTSIGRLDSFRDANTDRNMNMDMTSSSYSAGIALEETNTNVPIPAKRSANGQYQKLESPKEGRRQNHNQVGNDTRAMETVYEHESREAMIPPAQNGTITPNAPPMPDSGRQSVSSIGQHYADVPFDLPQ
jgi:hypothetical protein